MERRSTSCGRGPPSPAAASLITSLRMDSAAPCIILVLQFEFSQLHVFGQHRFGLWLGRGSLWLAECPRDHGGLHFHQELRPRRRRHFWGRPTDARSAVFSPTTAFRRMGLPARSSMNTRHSLAAAFLPAIQPATAVPAARSSSPTGPFETRSSPATRSDPPASIWPRVEASGTYGTLRIENSTIANNASGAQSQGAGIYNEGALILDNSTVSGNLAGPSSAGGGVFNGDAGGASVNVANTIIARNAAPVGPDVSGTLVSRGFNLIGNTEGHTGATASDLINIDPLLARSKTMVGRPQRWRFSRTVWRLITAIRLLFPVRSLRQ